MGPKYRILGEDPSSDLRDVESGLLGSDGEEVKSGEPVEFCMFVELLP